VQEYLIFKNEDLLVGRACGKLCGNLWKTCGKIGEK
jgi:hypothetical protein